MPMRFLRVFSGSGLTKLVLMSVSFSSLCEVSAQIVDFNQNRVFGVEADRKVYFSDGTPIIGTSFLAQLYYGVSADSLSPVLALPRSFRNILPSDPLAGTWFGTTRTLDGFSPGDTVTLQVRVWDGAVAGSYEEAAALGFLGTQHGMSAAFTYQIPSAAVPPYFYYIENFRAFTLVPEPSMVGLVIVGLGSLWFLKRRTS